ncbi:hypothetical protein AtubIFM57143_004432, partial [Aspergillus tubingensis]
MRAPSIVSALLSGVPPSNKIIPDVPLAATERPVFAEADTHDKEASAPDMSI